MEVGEIAHEPSRGVVLGAKRRTIIATGADAGLSPLHAGIRRRERRDALTFIAFTAPNFLLLAVFTFWPVLYSHYLSFFKWNMIAKRKTFLGTANYRTMAADPVFWMVVRNTFALAGAAVVVTLALALAVVLTRRIAGRSLYRMIIFSPTFTTSVAVAEEMAALGVTSVGVEKTWLSEPLYRELRARGVGVWTVDDPGQMRRFASMGVDFIASNRPDLLRRALADASDPPH